jgi:hypothetical protein
MGALITSRESSLERTHRETLNLPAILLESAYLSGEESDVKLLTLGIAYCGVGSDPSTIFFSLTLASQPHQHSFLALDPHGFHRVAYSEWGNPRQHRVVICVHGLTRNCGDFDSLAAALAGHFRVVCMDVVGRGASDWLEHKEDYGFGLYLSDAASLLALVAHEKRAGSLAKLIRRPTPQRSPFIEQPD